jgi:thiamine-phosphate pyrophosphorylase
MRHKPTIDYRLYLVTDRNLLNGKSLAQSVEDAIAGGVTVVQLREKTLGTRDFFDLALRVKAITDHYGIPLIINDRLDIALSVNAAGLHIGQGDLPVPLARKLLGPDKVLGVSAATVEEAAAARNEGADYLGIGAVFPTGTKTDARNVPVETLRRIRERIAIPIVAIGGINRSNARLVLNEGVDGIAVVSAILGAPDIRLAAHCLHDLCMKLPTDEAPTR